MRTWVIVGAMLVLCIAIPPIHAAGADVGIGVGNYWDYRVTVTEMGMSFGGVIHFEIMSKTTESIGGVDTEVLNAKGNFSTTMSYMGMTATESFRVLAGFLASNFSLVSMTMVMNASTSAYMGYPASYSSTGVVETFSPAFDLYVGDNDLSAGSSWTSHSNATTVSGWNNYNGVNETTTPSSSEGTVAFTVVATGQSVTVPAGTFSCAKLNVGSNEAGGGVPFNVYYSQDVKFYTKFNYSITEDTLSISMSAELKSYSLGSGGGDGDGGGVLGGTNGMLLIGGIVVIVVVVLVIALMLMRKRGAGKVPVQPAQPTEVPPPPPPT